MVILEALQQATDRLKQVQRALREEHRSGVPLLETQALLSSVLEKPRSYLLAHGDEALVGEDVERFFSFVERRAGHEPLAYILGWSEFFGRRFFVNPSVLIPRPETEWWVEDVIRQAKGVTDGVVLDIGTGSGVIGITLSAETGLPVLAVDRSAEALRVASYNAQLHGVENRMTFFEGNLLEPLERTRVKSVDAVFLCANLPYLSLGQWEQSPPEVRAFEPRDALEAGGDGLDAYRALLQQLKKRRKDFSQNLSVFLEMDPGQKASLVDLIRRVFPCSAPAVAADVSGRSRVLRVEI